MGRSLWVALEAVALLVPGSASAGFLGHEILYEFLLPYPSTTLESATFVAGAGPELTGGTAAGQPVMDLGESTISIGPFLEAHSEIVQLIFLDSGFRFSDFSGDLPGISGVAISPMTTVAGITPDRLEFTEDSIQLDLSGVVVGFGEVILLETAFVPEPATAVFVASGLLALLFRRRFRPARRRG